MINQIIQMGLNQILEIDKKADEWEERIRSDYMKTFSMPRKMKKRVRKDLNFDYSLCRYMKDLTTF